MRVTLEYQEQITTELDVQTVKWCASDSQEIGQASVRVSHKHPAFNPAYISEDKGSTIQIVDEELGRWNGIIVRTRFTNDGEAVELTCHDRRALFAGLPTGRQEFKLATAGAIVRQAFREAAGARSRVGLTEGIFVESAPLISEYEFDRDSLRDVINAMAERSGQEWSIDEGGGFHWIAREGTVKDEPLIQGHDLFDVSWETGALDRISEVIAIDDNGGELRFIAPEMADGGFWVARKISSGSDDEDVESRALRILEDERHPQPSVSARLAQHTWAHVREGDIYRFVLPSAGFAGASPVVRIMSRTWSGRSGQLDVQLQILPQA